MGFSLVFALRIYNLRIEQTYIDHHGRPHVLSLTKTYTVGKRAVWVSLLL